MLCGNLNGVENQKRKDICIYTPSGITALLWQWGMYNSMKLWDMLCRATQDGRVIAGSSDKR